MSFHNKEDRSFDMKFNSSKNYVISREDGWRPYGGNDINSEISSSLNSNDSNALSKNSEKNTNNHYCKSNGANDMIYKSSHDYVAGGNHYRIPNNNYNHSNNSFSSNNKRDTNNIDQNYDISFKSPQSKLVLNDKDEINSVISKLYEEYHFKKDGTPDEKYKSLKLHSSFNEKKDIRNNNYSNKENSADNIIQYNKKRTPDMKCKTSKKMFKHTNSIYNPKDDYYYRKDGSPDIKCVSSKSRKSCKSCNQYKPNKLDKEYLYEKEETFELKFKSKRCQSVKNHSKSNM